VVIYVAIVVLRAFSGGGYAERKFAAALGVLGTVNLPIIHYAVQRWGGTHPAVISKGGGGLKHPDMSHAFWFGVMTMLLFSVLLLWWRTQSTLNRARLQRVEEQALQQGILG
jgi:heme exporter protein C